MELTQSQKIEAIRKGEFYNKDIGGQPILRSHYIVKVKFDTYTMTKGPFDTSIEAEVEGKQELSRGAQDYKVEVFNPRNTKC